MNGFARCCVGLLFFIQFRVATAATEPMPVVATLPVLADLTREIGRSHVSVRSLITGLENEHTYTPAPGDLIAIQKARLLVKLGLGLEVWVEGLVQNVDRSDLVVVTASEGVLLPRDPIVLPGEEAMEQADREAEALGNVHIWMDPENAKSMVQQITRGLVKSDPAHQVDYLRNQTAYLVRLSNLVADLKEKVATLKDRRIVTHHAAWPHFARRFGFVIRGNIQIGGEGIEPSPKHLGALIQRIRREQIRVIVSEPSLSQKTPQILAKETGTSVLLLATMPGVMAGSDTYLKMMRHNVEALVTALSGR